MRFVYSQPFIGLLELLLRQRVPTYQGPLVRVPVLFSGMGLGKTRTAWEAVTTFVERRYVTQDPFGAYVPDQAMQASDTFDPVPGSRIAAYLRLPIPQAAEFTKHDRGSRHAAASLALAVALGLAFNIEKLALDALWTSPTPMVDIKRAFNCERCFLPDRGPGFQGCAGAVWAATTGWS